MAQNQEQNIRRPNALSTVLAVAACKAARSLLRLRGSGGTALPGKVAMAFARNILAVTSQGMEIIVVTGTNGKTTTCRMLEHAMTASGRECLANKSGANLLSGVTAELTCNATWTGRPRTHYAVIECDEGALKQVVPLIRPKVIVVTNLFRDQLDRYGEITHTRDEIRKGIEASKDAVVCLNADDSLVSSLAFDLPNKVVYYGFDIPVGDQQDPEISDAKYCVRCGHEYQYRYHTYAHLGSFYCPACGYARQNAAVAVTGIREIAADGSRVTLRIGDKAGIETRVGLPAVYNLYNALAAVCAWTETGFPTEEMLRSLADVHSSFGRMETFALPRADGEGTVRVQMILVKNPTGCNQALEYVAGMREEFVAVYSLNDRTADGHDISWIWDADYERTADPAKDPWCRQILVSGDRAEDMRLRLKYAGAPEDRITMIKDNDALLETLRQSQLPVFILPNYTSMLALRKLLSEATGGKEFWK